MRVLVTGASGAIGAAVCRALVAADHEVIGVLGERDANLPPAVRTVRANLFAPDALFALAREADAAVHAASSNDERAAELDTTVVDALVWAFSGTQKALVYTSGLWLHGNTGDQPATEESPLAPPQVVSWRPRIEEMLVTAARDLGVRTVRIRPALVHGDESGYLPALLAPYEGVVRHIGDGTNRWSTVHTDDLAELYVAALERAPAGSVYLGADENRSFRVADLAKVTADRIGARVEAWAPSEAEQHWGVMVEALLLDQVASGAKAREELGWSPSRPTALDELR
ncbi:NAD-dependent epimerase/dehydratase family protein [Allokutzneria sp. A3M-2-11 16]|uniref:NAD-dependent epimerase/dehydratase family protein n=1 Tax=Allokutzneria sp. A3M-2-11 16 TaxID=2962043 RepID=UPI0020B75FB5|nr:NAD-dependent epimerase/dehydratase family protein [Allokutzneria sp. A3M-2-11 16]MCP3805535.1 NAD-dependent epimerase/dehydratase family protein [Allokutzneria sp. A3M-2-11 16]